MVTTINNEHVKTYIGLSTDTKPGVLEHVTQGTTFIAIDTKKVYIYYLTAAGLGEWQEITSLAVLNIK